MYECEIGQGLLGNSVARAVGGAVQNATLPGPPHIQDDFAAASYVEFQIFVQPASIIYWPSGASKSRLASGRQSSHSQNQSLIGFARTRRCLLLVSNNHNQTLLAGKRGDSSTRCKSKDLE